MHSQRPDTSSAAARRQLAIAAIAEGSAITDGTANAGVESAAPAVSEGNVAAAPEATAPTLDDTTPVLGLIDVDQVAEAFDQLTAAFASQNPVLHAVAAKAVPLRPLLHFFAEAGGGCEVASPGELELAAAAGFAPESIVFDSPAKTWTELKRAVELGVSMNADNFEELARLDILLEGRATSARMGIRINPQSGAGRIGALSTATETSKFGIGLSDEGNREALIAAYLARPWLTQIHVHSGSQGVGLDQAAEGIAAVVDLAQEINARVGAGEGAGQGAGHPTDSAGHPTDSARQVTRIDIGGGLPVNFAGEDITPTFADYRAAIDARVPALFDFEIVTEFGRALLAKAGTTLTRVEYAKTTGGRRIAMTHAGAQVATRTAYAPDDWPLRVLGFDPQGRPKTTEAVPTKAVPTEAAPTEAVPTEAAPTETAPTEATPTETAPSETVPTDVAGPACFAGDLIARDRLLPRLDAGDLVAVPDTGAYYFSNSYSYNMLPRVPVYGYRSSEAGAALEFLLIRRGQGIAEVLAEAGEAALTPLPHRPRKAGETDAKEQGALAPH
ncbi:MAG: diaminopimelate decarboxylase [Brevibacterium sp.]